MLKPINSAWNGGIPDSDGKTEWWLNTLLIFGVDGSLHNRDDHNYTPVPDDELLSDKILNDENRLYRQMMLGNWVELFFAAHASEILEVYEELDIPMQSLLLIMMMRLLQVIYFMSVKLFMQ